MNINHLELGQKTHYDAYYNPKRLLSIPRCDKREELGISKTPPFYGFDCWNHYEVSWLNDKGKPMVATAEIIYDCHTVNLIESKSLKLYFNSLNNTTFNSLQEVSNTVKQDLQQHLNTENIIIEIHPLETVQGVFQSNFDGECIDHLDVECSVYQVSPQFLTSSKDMVAEVLYSNLLKSNCLVTNQPDWGSVQISYTGGKINREGLLKYLVSFRNHNEFHEQCIERIFMDLLTYCKPHKLSVYGRYTRRGGLDINPFRSTEPDLSVKGRNIRLYRQ